MNRVFSFLFVFLILAIRAKSQSTWSLQQCIDTALKNNIPVQRAGLQTQTAQVNWQQSRMNLLPDLFVDVSHGLNAGRSIDPSTNTFVNQNVSGGNYGVNSNVTLFNGLTLQNRVKQNAYELEATKMQQQQTKDELVLNVILGYLSVLNNEDQLQLAYQQAATSQAALDRLQVMNSQGAVKPSDVSDLKGQLMNDQLNILNAKNTLETSKLALAQLMNRNYDSSMKVEKINVEEFLTNYPSTANDVYQTSLSQFALVKAVELQKTSSFYSWKAAKGRMYPTLSLGAGINTRYSSLAENAGVKIPYTDQLRNFKNTAVGLQLSIPIFNHSTFRNQAKLADIILKDNELVESNTKQQLHQQIDQAYLNMSNAYDRYKVLLTQVDAYDQSFKAAETRYKAGVGTSIDYLTAKDRLDRANINLINAKYDFVLRKRILDYYSGKNQ